jgi:DNA-binding transcriptional MerR regulator
MPELTPDTEVYRIEGIVNVDKDCVQSFKDDISKYLNESGWIYAHTVNIVPQDSETGMRLYKVEDIEAYKGIIAKLESACHNYEEAGKINDKLFKSLSEELAQERERLERLKKAYDLVNTMYEARGLTNNNLIKEIQALETRLRISESRPWNKFIKWCKRVWQRSK